MRKANGLLLSVLLILCAMFVFPFSANATSVSQASAVAWAQSKIGSGLDYDGEWGNQCVDFIYYYYSYLGVSPVGGNACDYSSNTLPAGWTRISSNITPQPGDIAVWKSYYNDGVYSTTWAGHISIVVSGNSSTFNTIHQNFNDYTTCIQSNNIPTAILACVIRPNFSSTSSGPTLSWTDYSDKQSIGSQNAILARRCDLSGVNSSSVSQVGIYLYDYNGTQLDSFSETVNLGSHSWFYLWYDINSELGYTLSSGTTYKYKFMAIINGKTYYSPEYSFQTTGTHSHKYNSGTVTASATCTATGTRVYTCTTCGGTRNESISALGHNYSSSWTVDKAATCTTAGSKSRHCTRCSSKGSVTAIAATGHSYGKWSTTTVATCTATGTQKRTCANCSNVESTSVSALGHSYSSSWTVDKAANCTIAGSKSHHCTRCSSQKDVSVISALGHAWSKWTVTVQPTTTSTGLQVRTCSNGCGTQETGVIAKLAQDGHDHTYGEWSVITAPSCIEAGVQQKQCTICKATEQQSVAATGHNYNDWAVVTAPTCTQGGIQQRQCKNCPQTEQQTTEALGHSYGQWKVSATEGVQERICEECSAVETITVNTENTQPTNNDPTTMPTEIRTDSDEVESVPRVWFIVAIGGVVVLAVAVVIFIKFSKSKK